MHVRMHARLYMRMYILGSQFSNEAGIDMTFELDSFRDMNIILEAIKRKQLELALEYDIYAYLCIYICIFMCAHIVVCFS